MIRRCRVRSLNPKASRRHGRHLSGRASREQAFENPFHLLTYRTLRTALFTARASSCGFNMSSNSALLGKERPIKIGRCAGRAHSDARRT